MRKAIVWFLLLCALGTGCARFPSDGGQQSGRRLIITIKVAGRIDPAIGNYFFLINGDPATQIGSGMEPVAAPPWGNGIAVRPYNYFVVWRADVQDYRLYRVDPANEQNFQEIGRPIASIPPNISQDANTLQFELLLTQIPLPIPPGQTDPPTIESIKFNLIATDKWGNSLSNQDTKIWDALGDARTAQPNRPIVLDIRQDRIINNTDRNPDPTNPEPEDDVIRSGAAVQENVAIPNLDISDWQVEVRS